MTYDEAFKPYWMKVKTNDPFEYKLRSKEEVYLQMYQLPPLMQGSVVTNNSFFDVNRKPTSNNNKFNSVKLFFKFEELKLFPLQLQRFIFLLGDRHVKGRSYFKLVVSREYDRDKNIAIGYDIIKQMYLEASRAPIYMEDWMSKEEIEIRNEAYGGEEKAKEFFKDFFLTEEYKKTEDYAKFTKWYKTLTDPNVSDEVKSRTKFDRIKEIYSTDYEKYFNVKKIIDAKLDESNEYDFVTRNEIEL